MNVSQKHHWLRTRYQVVAGYGVVRGLRSDGILFAANHFVSDEMTLRAMLDKHLSDEAPKEYFSLPLESFKGSPGWKESA